MKSQRRNDGWRRTAGYGLPVWILLALAGCRRQQKLDEATQHLVAAQAALAQGDQTLAMKELDASITAGASEWAYLERAKLRQTLGQEKEAIDDCQKGLELNQENAELKWYLAELKKPKTQRFRGTQAQPPSAAK